MLAGPWEGTRDPEMLLVGGSGIGGNWAERRRRRVEVIGSGRAMCRRASVLPLGVGSPYGARWFGTRFGFDISGAIDRCGQVSKSSLVPHPNQELGNPAIAVKPASMRRQSARQSKKRAR